MSNAARILKRRSLQFELATTGAGLAALFIGPMWMDYLHNNWPGSTVLFQGLIGGFCTLAALGILARLLWIYRE